MKSRLELVLGIDNRIPAPPHATRIVVSDAEPLSGAAGYARGCLWIRSLPPALYVNAGDDSGADWAAFPNVQGAESAASQAIADFIGRGDTLPSSAAVVGQLFIRTGATSPGLYVSTGTTTPGWKAVTHAS